MRAISGWMLCGLVIVGACTGDNRSDAERRAAAAPPVQAAERQANAATVAWQDSPAMSQEELERGRYDAEWRQVVELDSVPGAAAPRNPERWDSITADLVNQGTMIVPLYGEVAGPSVLRTQVMLDRAVFSPGIMDGRWGKNTEKAIYWLQRREGLPRTGRLDKETLAKLTDLAGNPQQIIRAYTLTAEDVKGPFVDIPDDIYEHAKLECSCYESLTEKLSEQFHVTPDLLAKLNPDVQLDGLAAGQTIQVPNVREPSQAGGANVSRIVVSDRGKYLHALDSSGRILYHFPTTLGSSYDPSPAGDFKVTRVAKDPDWHYQPAILAHVESSKPDALIPPGPNNAVGLVWMALSVPHYGIHGTRSPETIGYASSAGCVRLTNWDALFLADRVRPGTPVEFRDTESATGGRSATRGDTARQDTTRATRGGQRRS
ncbi:hypothetical protein BH23GEM5_BH23GEM5_11190 [soil metagenome]